MRHRLTSSLAIAATLTFLPLALCAQASPSQASTTADTAPAANQALQMVPASAKLLDPLDGKKLQPGAEFKAVLSQKVHLANGLGTAQAAPYSPALSPLTTSGVKGSAKLAVQFTSAQLKDGQLIPIRAIIVGLYTTANEPSTIYDGYNPKAPRNDWNGKTLGVDQIGGVPGIDLHSKVASRNSGVFVATEKNDVKVPKGCDLNLAISAQAGVPLNASQPSSASRPTGN